jgi:hypothetical protein
MRLSEYLIEAIAKRVAGKYGPRPEKESLVDWCIEHDFEELEWRNDFTASMYPDENCFLVGPNSARYSFSNWLKVHNKKIGYVTFWFGSSDKVTDIRYDNAKSLTRTIGFDEATKILISMLE